MMKTVRSKALSITVLWPAQQLLHSIQLLLSISLAQVDSASGANDSVVYQQKSNKQIENALDQYGNSILRLAYSYLHGKEDAEDILQETMIRYMSKAPAFESPDHEKAWLLRVAANLSKNKIKYGSIRPTDELKEELEAEKEDDLSFVWEAVTKLSVDQRSVIHLFYQEGYPTAQIAQILGMKESTVRSHLKRGRDRLRTILKEEYDFE